MRWLVGAVTLVTLAGCGYVSHYRPPLDGRARPLWRGDHVESNLLQLRAYVCRQAILAVPDDHEDAADYVDPLALRDLVLFALLLPVVDVFLAVDRPENEHFSAAAIDDVNAYNDRVRRGGAPCSSGAPP